MTSDVLAGWRVLIGRSPGRSGTLIERLAAEGAVAQAIPFIQILPPEGGSTLDAAVLDLAAGEYDWVVFTSVNAVAAVTERARALGADPAVPAGTRVAAVGPATADALHAGSLPVDLVPATGGSGAALAMLFPHAAAGQSALLPQSAIAADLLPSALRDKGYRVVRATAYRTVSRPPPDSVAADLATGRYEAVLLASPSGVAALAELPIDPRTRLVAIGEPTAAALASAGTPASAVAASPTDTDIVAALTELAAPRPAD